MSIEANLDLWFLNALEKSTVFYSIKKNFREKVGWIKFLNGVRDSLHYTKTDILRKDLAQSALCVQKEKNLIKVS